MELGRRGSTCVVPIGFGESHCRMTALDTCTVDQNMDVVAHSLKSTWKKTANLVKILEVAVYDSSRCPTSDNGVISFLVFGTICRRTLDKTNICASFCEGEGTSSTDAACCTGDENVVTVEVKERGSREDWGRIHRDWNEIG